MNEYSNAQPGDEPVDVTKSFDRKKICILRGDLCFSARLDQEKAPVEFWKCEPRSWETFTVCVMPDGWCALRCDNGSYISVRPDHHIKEESWDFSNGTKSGIPPKRMWKDRAVPMLYATATEPRSWEMFRIFRIGTLYALQAQFNENYIGDWHSAEPLKGQEYQLVALGAKPAKAAGTLFGIVEK